MANTGNMSVAPELADIKGIGFDPLTDSLVKIRDEQTLIEGAGFVSANHGIKSVWNDTDAMNNLISYLSRTGANLNVSVQDVGVLNDIDAAGVTTCVVGGINTMLPANPTVGSAYAFLEKASELVALNTAGYDLSDELIHSNDAEGAMKLFAYTPVRKIICPIDATIRIKFEIKTELAAQMAYGKIYKNGVTYGIERTSIVETYTEFSEDLAFVQDDTIELWCRVANTSWDCSYKNFNVYGNLHKYFVNTL